MIVDGLGGGQQCLRATDLKTEYDRKADRYGRRMTQSITATYFFMMMGVGLGMLDVPYAPKVCGVLVVLFFIRLCVYSTKFNNLIQLEKEE